MNLIKKSFMFLLLGTGLFLGQSFTLNNVYAKSGLDFSGTITVPDASYWNSLTVGVITVSKSDDTAKIKSLLRETSKGLKIIKNLYYYDTAKKGGASFSLEKGSISGTDSLKRNFAVSLPLPTDPAKSHYIVAFVDKNGNGKWDVENANTYFGVAGSESIQLPILPSYNYDKKMRVDCVLGSFKAKSANSYYFAFMSGEPNALSTTYAVFEKNISGAVFDFTGNTSSNTSVIPTTTPKAPIVENSAQQKAATDKISTAKSLQAEKKALLSGAQNSDFNNGESELKNAETAFAKKDYAAASSSADKAMASFNKVTKPAVVLPKTGSVEDQAKQTIEEADMLLAEKKAKFEKNASYKMAVRNLNTAKAALRRKDFAGAKKLSENAVNLLNKLK